VGHKDKVRSVAVSSKGTIASGDTGGEIRLWDGATGRFLRAFRGQKAQIPSLAFTPDGKRLVAGIAKLANSVPPFEVAVWNVATGARERVFTAHDGGVWAVAVSPDGRVAASAGGKSMPIYLWDPATGQRVRGAGNAPLSLQGTGSSVFAVAFSADSKRIAWGFTNKADKPNARGPLEFTLQLPTATQGLDKVRPLSNRTGAGFVGAVVVKRNVSLVHRLGGEPPRPEGILDIREGARTVGSIVRGSATGHRHLSYTFSPDGNTIISGGANGILVAYDAKGQEIGPFVGHEGDVWAVATSPDGQMLLSGGEDQIVRLWNLQKRELIVSLFQGGNEWIMWTPQGYYASSPDGDRLVGWQINKGLDKAAEYYTARQLKGQFYRPDIVERALVMASADRAYEEAQKADPARLRFDLNALLDRKPPKFSIAQPADGARVSASSAEILIAFEEASDPITRVEVFVGGTQVTPADLRGFTPVVSESRSRNIRVPLAKGENRIVVRVSNAVGTTDGKLTLFGAGPGALDRRGTLFIVAIGVNKYPQLPAMCRGPEGSCELNHAGADARAFIQEMARKAGMLHQRVETRLLVNGAGGEYEPTSANIINALSVLKQSTENDSVIVFLSGHGANEEIKGRKNYLFLPTDARRNQGGWVDSTVFDWALLERSLSNASGRRVLFVDTCHAANSYSAQILKNAADDNVVVFTAADREAEAQEQGALGHGVFTYAILRGLEGEAARDKDVWVLDLATFVDREVRRLTNGGQVPEFRQGGKNYVIARTP
jgi:WD40 repeat protein